MKKFVVVMAVTGLLAGALAPAQAQPRQPKTWDQVVESSVEYAKTQQAKDGSWAKDTNPGITAILVTGLLKSGKVKADDPLAAKALEFIVAQASEKEGHLAGVGADGKPPRQANYLTAANLIALKASGDKKYDTLAAGATKFLKTIQWDEAQEKKPADAYYGGVGYGKGARPDLSNTLFYLEAMHAQGVESKDPVFTKGLTYVSRMQNLKAEFNDQPWASKIDDGSFIYVGVVAQPGTPDTSDQAKPGYGSMTCAGFRCLIMCGVSKEDLRYKKALEWLSKNYSVDVNPGMQPGGGGRGYYFYLLYLAEAMSAAGIDEITDAQGKKHDWRAEIRTALTARQRKDGSWGNETSTWMESNPELCTGYALQTLSFCKPKAQK